MGSRDPHGRAQRILDAVRRYVEHKSKHGRICDPKWCDDMEHSGSVAIGSSRRLRAAQVAILGSALGLAVSAQAQLNMTAAAGAAYEYNSNVFAIPAGSAIPSPYVGTGHSSSIQTYTGDLHPTYDWSEQRLVVDLQGREQRFDSFSQLNHTEYTARADLDWASGSRVQGTLGAFRERRMVRFIDVVTSELLLETETRGNAGIVIPVGNRWRVEGDVLSKQDDSPRPGSPDLSLQEKSGKVGLKYNPYSDLFVGLTSEYLKGEFAGIGTGIPNSGPSGYVDYRQEETLLVADRKTSKTDSMHAGIGYTRRTLSSGTSSISTVTGELSYVRDITGKTSVTFGVSREANAYITTTSAEIDNIAQAGVQWRPTGKATVKLNERWVRSKYPDWYVTVGTGPTETFYQSERDDTSRETRLELEYQIVPQITIRPYVTYDDRSSNIAQFNYAAKVYGIELRGQLP